MQSFLIHTFLERSALYYPDKTALVHGDNRLSYCQLNKNANRLAHFLIASGTAPGDRIVLLLENSCDYAIAYYAVLKAGCVAVPIAPDMHMTTLAPLLARISPVAVIASTPGERILRSCNLSHFSVLLLILSQPIPQTALHHTTIATHILEEIISTGTSDNPSIEIDENTLASILFTSGSTGNPKGVMLSHRNITTNTTATIHYLHLSPQEIHMVVIPFWHVTGNSLLNTHIAVGGTLIINMVFAFPVTVLQQMIDENVTGFSGVPATYTHLLHRSPLKLFREKLPTLRYCSQAGGRLASYLKKELLESLPAHTKLYVMYGATETAPRLTFVEPERLGAKMDSIGVPISGITLRIIDESGREVPDGQTGEIVASGPNIMLGYWDDLHSTARVITKLGYHTGDMGYRDQDGYYYTSGRKDALLKVGGCKVNHLEIEEALITTGLVIETVVMGISDPLLGQTLKALAIPRNDATTPHAILAAARKLLPQQTIPVELTLVAQLPTGSNGKTDRAACLALVS